MLSLNLFYYSFVPIMQLELITEQEVETLKAAIRDAENIIVLGHKSSWMAMPWEHV